MSIAEYLRGLRGRLEPQALGLPYAGQRRVPGLRREEVAVLAGISVDYYRRLEQGREHSPSAQIIGALARGLDLAGDEREHLFRLAGYASPLQTGPEQIRPELTRLISRWHDQAAFVLTGTLDVMAPNTLAKTLFSPLGECRNLARTVFLNPASRTFYQDWDHAAVDTVAVLRHNSTLIPATVLDPFVTELAEQSQEFRSLWERQHVRGKTHAAKRLHHRDVGDLTLAYQALDIPGFPGHQVIIYDADPGSASAEALSLLRLAPQGTSADSTTHDESDHLRSHRPSGSRAARRPSLSPETMSSPPAARRSGAPARETTTTPG